MKFPQPTLEEKLRLNALHSYEILDTPSEKRFDELVSIAAATTNSPVSMVSIIDDTRQWFKAKIGTEINNIPRKYSFCAHTINEEEGFLEVINTLEDDRFKENPAVIGKDQVRFYAGVVIRDKNNFPLGTICVLDTKPKKLSENQIQVLQILSKKAKRYIEEKIKLEVSILKNSELLSILDNIHDSIFELDAFGNITYVNSHARHSFQCEEIMGNKFIELLSKKDKQRFSRIFANLLKKNKELINHKFEIRYAQRAPIWIELSLKIIEDKDKPIRIIASSRDITIQRKYFKTLQQLSAVAENTTNSVVIMNEKFVIKWANESFLKIFKVEKNKIVRRIFPNLLAKLNPITHVVKDGYFKEAQIQEKTHFEYSFINKKGNVRWLEFLIDPVFGKGKAVQNYICIGQDITKRKKQQLKIKRQNKEIYYSLEYATRIQHATLPSLELRDKLKSKSFVLYYPKDIVSGDFYITELIERNNKQEIEIFAVADCTGHGIPGAMLSVLCCNLLNEAIKNKSVNNSGEALNYVKRKLYDFLQFNVSEIVYDGMDVALLYVDKTNKEVLFSGANRPLYKLSNGNLETFRGDRQSVGFSRINKPFTTITIPYKKGDQYYLFSDGLPDQFGGERNKKFMSKRLKEIIISNEKEKQEIQEESITKEFFNWKGNAEQTDDICFMGIKLS